MIKSSSTILWNCEVDICSVTVTSSIRTHECGKRFSSTATHRSNATAPSLDHANVQINRDTFFNTVAGGPLVAHRYTPLPNLRLDARMDATEVRQFVLVQNGISVTNPDPGGVPLPPGKPKIVPTTKILGCQMRFSRTSIYKSEKKPKLSSIITSQSLGGTVMMMFRPMSLRPKTQNPP